MTGAALHQKYRPTTWDEVIGQDAALKSLRGVLKRKESQAFLLSGPAGVGKTTIARLCADDLKCTRQAILETDAATHTGIDAMRDIQQMLQYQPFGGTKSRAIILDEAHRLSAQAWDSLLKSVEEPPQDAYWFFCTTNEAKVPATIKTRCTHVTLKLVSNKDLMQLLDEVCDVESIDVPDDVADVVVEQAKGSPRQMLVNLALCRDITSRREAADVLRTAMESDATIALCRFIVKGGSWKTAMTLLDKLRDENPEGVRIVVVNYLGSALKGVTNDKDAMAFLQLIECFATPYHPAEGMTPLLLSVGRALFAE